MITRNNIMIKHKTYLNLGLPQSLWKEVTSVVEVDDTLDLGYQVGDVHSGEKVSLAI